MPQANVTMNDRHPNSAVSIIDIAGQVTAFAENVLMDAYTEASNETTRAVILNYSELEYMNNSGIGLLVTLLIRAQRRSSSFLAYGLNDHYRQIFDLTRLDEAMPSTRARPRRWLQSAKGGLMAKTRNSHAAPGRGGRNASPSLTYPKGRLI